MPAARHAIGNPVGIGLVLGPAAWFLTQQATYYLASKPCGFVRPTVMLLVDVLGLAAALGGAALAWRDWQLPVAAPHPAARAERNFAAGLAVTLCLLFAVAIVWQGMATFFFSGCER